MNAAQSRSIPSLDRRTGGSRGRAASALEEDWDDEEWEEDDWDEEDDEEGEDEDGWDEEDDDWEEEDES